MTEEKRTSKSKGIPGGSTLIMAFAVMCLTVFAILALSTVLADVRLSDSYAQNVSLYYNADSIAQKTIAQLRAGQISDGVSENEGEYCFSVPVSDTKTLFVRLKTEGSNIDITDYHTEYTGAWEGEDYYNELWKGD